MATGTARIMQQVRQKVDLFEKAKKLTNTLSRPSNLRRFGEWLEVTGCSGSVDLYLRVGGQMGLRDRGGKGDNVCKDASVQAYLSGLKKRQGDDPNSDTPLPLVMAVRSLEKLDAHPEPLIATRETVALETEFPGGPRVSEMAGAGVNHGAECGPGYCRVYANRVEYRYDHRKASNTAEFLTIARHTKTSGFDVGARIIKMAAAHGRAMEESFTETGEFFQFIDYWVVRVNLQGMTDPDVEQLDRLASRRVDVRTRKYLSREAKARRQAKDSNRRFLNVEGGTKAEMEEALAWWRSQKGIEASMTPGPLLTSTMPGSKGRVATNHAWAPASLAAVLKDTFNEVFEELTREQTTNQLAAHVEQAAGVSQAAEQLMQQLSSLPQNLDGPKWNSHSCRRGGTKLARELMDLSGASTEDIDRHFGWSTGRGNTKKQQVAYAGMLPVARRVAVTEFF